MYSSITVDVIIETRPQWGPRVIPQQWLESRSRQANIPCTGIDRLVWESGLHRDRLTPTDPGRWRDGPVAGRSSVVEEYEIPQHTLS